MHNLTATEARVLVCKARSIGKLEWLRSRVLLEQLAGNSSNNVQQMSKALRGV